MSRPIVLFPHLFRLIGAFNFRNDYSPSSSPPSRPYTEVDTEARHRTLGVRAATPIRVRVHGDIEVHR